VMRAFIICACACALGGAVAGCGAGGEAGRTAPLPPTGVAYRALGDADRLAVAATCRERAATHTRGLAARQLHTVELDALREQLDSAYTIIAEQRRPVARVCAEVLPFVTPGLRLTFEGAKDDHDGTFSVETTSDKRLAIRGRITPAPANGRVIAQRDGRRRALRSAAVGPDGSFALPGLRLRKVADNTFILTIEASPNAPRKVLFSAICLDCLAGGTPPSAQQ